MQNPVLDQERLEFLKARDTGARELLSAWPRAPRELPRVQVAVDWLKFSTLNHRTRAEQLKVIHDSKKLDLFTADPTGQEAQDAQYKILINQKGFDELKKDLKERGQQNWAIITADGVLINGNRRAAALRSLYLDDHYLKAEYLTCLVLPLDATVDEIINLEAELQVARDFKEDYSWINEAILIEELYERNGRNFDRVAKKMHRDPGDVRSYHEKLQQVHQLVALSKGTRLHIDFEENESAFDELTKHIRTKTKAEGDGVRAAYFLGTLANVNYRTLRHLRRSDAAELVMKEIRNDSSLASVLNAISSSKGKTDDDKLLDDVLGPQSEGCELSDILAFVATRKPEESLPLANNTSVVIQDVLDTLESAINAAADEAEEEQRDITAVTTPIKRAEKSFAELERANVALVKARKFENWDEASFAKQLGLIESLLNKMKIKK